MTSPEPITAPGIHDLPNEGAASPRTQEQMRATGEAMVKIILAQVLYAISGINVLGVSLLDPFGLLRAFADDLVEQANDAYNNAATAQTSADTANSGVVGLLALQAATNVPGGVAINDSFDRTASDLGANYSQEYFGAGAGGLGTNGSNAHWSEAGAVTRGCWARHVTALATDDQMAALVQTSPVLTSNEKPQLFLILRADSTLDNFVLAAIEMSVVEIGYVVSGTYTRLGAQESVTSANGDRWEFRAGTLADERQFLLYRNDALVCDRTDSGDVSQMGASYRYPGLGMRAGVNFEFFAFFQKSPPDIQAYGAADRAAA